MKRDRSSWGASALASASPDVRRMNPQAFAPQARRRAVQQPQPVPPANLPWRFTWWGAPATKGNSRSGPGTMPSEFYLAWLGAVRAQTPAVRLSHGLEGEIEVRCQVTALVYRTRDVGDVDNFHKAIGDALQSAGYIVNDKLIKSWDGTRLLIDTKRPRVELVITEVVA